MAIFQNWRNKRRLEAARTNLELSRLQTAEAVMSKVLEKTRFIKAEPDDHMWMLHGQGPEGIHTTNTEGGAMPVQDHYLMLVQAMRVYKHNLFARAIIRNLAKFILGKGPKVKAVEENEKFQEAWDDWAMENRWNHREKEMIIRTFRDGECFLRFFENVDGKGMAAVRFIRSNFIRNPADMPAGLHGRELVSYGIGTNPQDIEDVKSYYLTGGDGTLIEKIPANEVLHIKIMADSDMKRGISFLMTALPMLKKYEDWLEDRIVLNRVRSAIAMIRKIEGTAGTIESIRDEYQTERTSSDQNRQKMPRRGTVITAGKGINYEMLSPKIQASDVKDDGRAMLLAVAAGMGFPEQFLTSDYSNANYSSSMVAQNPFVREIEDWQDFFSYHYRLIYKRVIKAFMEHGDLPKSDNSKKVECEIEWPPLILADIEKNNKAREIMFRNKIISRTTWQLKEGLDPDVEKRHMKQEEGEEVYQDPFNLPLTPTNQYGTQPPRPGKTAVPGGGTNKLVLHSEEDLAEEEGDE